MAQAIYIYTHMYIHMSYVYICACVFQFRRLLAQRVHFFSYLILLQSIYFFIARRMQNSHPSYLAIWDVLSKLEDVNHVIDLREHTEQTIVFTIKLGCSAYVSLKTNPFASINSCQPSISNPPGSQCKWGMFHDQIKLSGVC